MSDPAETGQKVLAALTAGRRRAIEQRRADGAVNARAVRSALDLDVLAGRPARGRAGRIARLVRGRVRVRVGREVRTYISERGVRKILERLSGGSDSLVSNAHESQEGQP